MNFEDTLAEEALKNRRIYLWGEVNDEVGVSVIDQMYLHFYKNPSLPIHLLINSEGGLMTSCEAIIDEMECLKRSGVIISTICMGMAYSAAAIILALGTKGHRFARKNCSIMLHPVSFGLENDYIDQQKKMSTFLNKKISAFNRHIADYLGKDYKKYAKEIKDGLWLNADEAEKYGVIDAVSNAPLPQHSC